MHEIWRLGWASSGSSETLSRFGSPASTAGGLWPAYSITEKPSLPRSKAVPTPGLSTHLAFLRAFPHVRFVFRSPQKPDVPGQTVSLDQYCRPRRSFREWRFPALLATSQIPALQSPRLGFAA